MTPHNTQVLPTILAIVGDSAAGKTTLADGIADIVGRESAAIICADDYHRFDRAERAHRGLTPSAPETNHLDIFEQHLRLLKRGEPILKPFYDHTKGAFGPAQYIEPKNFIIVEGLLCCHTRAMRDCFDVKVFMEPEEPLRVRWKLYRDTVERGYDEAQVKALLEKNLTDSDRFVRPQRVFADIVVSFYRPQGEEQESSAHLNARHILRPTLPHPDITPLLEPTLANGLSLALSRDRDGKPVDVLEISGEVDDRRAKRLEDLLWHLLPETSVMRAKIGEIQDGRRGRVVSHPLALTELLIAYHLEMAAHDPENR